LDKPYIASCFVVSLLVLAITLKCADTYLYFLPTIYLEKARLLDGKAKTTKTLILGSSHGLFGISPKILGDALNLSNVSQLLLLDDKILDKVLTQTNDLKLETHRSVSSITYESWQRGLL